MNNEERLVGASAPRAAGSATMNQDVGADG